MPKSHERLDQALKQRILELDITWVELASASRVSIQTLSAIRAGRNRPNERTQRRIEDALGWAHGSITTVMDGGDPATADTADDRIDRLERQIFEALDEIRRLRSAQEHRATGSG
ncbi:MAG: helix-turn-helix domain-containing protein [Actinoallomurus sp.]